MTSDTIEIGIISRADVAASELVLGGAGNGLKGQGGFGPVFRKLREEEVAEYVFFHPLSFLLPFGRAMSDYLSCSYLQL